MKDQEFELFNPKDVENKPTDFGSVGMGVEDTSEIETTDDRLAPESKEEKDDGDTPLDDLFGRKVS